MAIKATGPVASLIPGHDVEVPLRPLIYAQPGQPVHLYVQAYVILIIRYIYIIHIYIYIEREREKYIHICICIYVYVYAYIYIYIRK